MSVKKIAAHSKRSSQRFVAVLLFYGQTFCMVQGNNTEFVTTMCVKNSLRCILGRFKRLQCGIMQKNRTCIALAAQVIQMFNLFHSRAQFPQLL